MNIHSESLAVLTTELYSNELYHILMCRLRSIVGLMHYVRLHPGRKWPFRPFSIAHLVEQLGDNIVLGFMDCSGSIYESK